MPQDSGPNFVSSQYGSHAAVSQYPTVGLYPYETSRIGLQRDRIY